MVAGDLLDKLQFWFGCIMLHIQLHVPVQTQNATASEFGVEMWWVLQTRPAWSQPGFAELSCHDAASSDTHWFCMVLCCVLLRTVPDPECRLELELEGRAIGRQLSLSEGPSLEAPSRCDFDVQLDVPAPQRKGKNHWVVGISGQTHCKPATFFECYWLDLPTSTHKSQTFLSCRDL